MQQVKVKDIRHIHSKPDAPKKWHLVALVDAEDQEYTTFDLAVVDVGIGGVIEFDVEMKRGKANIAEGWKIISKGTPEGEAAPAPEPKTNGKPDMSKDDWAEKDRLERLSIEQMSAWRGIVELAAKPDIKLPPDMITEFFDVLKNGLAWANNRLTTTTPAKTTTKTEKTVTKKETEADKDFDELSSGSEFKNAAEFAARVKKDLGIYPSGICKKMGVDKIEEIADYQAAYELLKEDTDK